MVKYHMLLNKNIIFARIFEDFVNIFFNVLKSLSQLKEVVIYRIVKEEMNSLLSKNILF